MGSISLVYAVRKRKCDMQTFIDDKVHDCVMCPCMCKIVKFELDIL